MTVSEPAGCVYVVSTPIGNLEDLSPRALRILREASLVVCEDTRRTARLCARFGITTRRLSLHAHNETRRTPELLRRLERGVQRGFCLASRAADAQRQGQGQDERGLRMPAHGGESTPP